MRFDIRRCRRELVRQHQLVEAAATCALLGAAGNVNTGRNQLSAIFVDCCKLGTEVDAPGCYRESNSQVPGNGLAQRRNRVDARVGFIMLHKLLLSSVALVGLTGLAGAADLAFKAPPPVYISTWTSCYVGGHAGYGMANSTSQYSAIEMAEAGLAGEFNESYNNKGFVGGGQAGCQYQTGTFLWGLEGDWSSFSNSSSYNHAGTFTDEEEGEVFNGSVNQSLHYSSLWSVRGRFGIIASDVFHFYGTAGIGGAKANYTSSASFTEAELDDRRGRCVCVSSASNVGLNPTGIVFGAGAEWKIWPNFIVGAEYLHYAFNSTSAIPANAGGFLDGAPTAAFVGPSGGDHVSLNSVDVIRLRASYLFNWGR
jgi:outer membrane immunogenic protein